MSIDKCILDAKEKSGLDKDSADTIEKQLEGVRGGSDASSFNENLSNYKRKRRIENLRARNRQLQKLDSIRQRFETASKFTNKGEGIIAGLVGTKYSNKTKGLMSAHTRIEELRGKYETIFQKAMRDANLEELIDNKKSRIALTQDVYKQYYGIETGNNAAKVVSEAFRKVDETRTNDKINAGIISQGLDNRFIGKRNDPTKMIEAGFVTWKTDQIKASGMKNIKRAFPDLVENGDMNVVKLDKVMRDIYDKITLNQLGYIPLDFNTKAFGRSSPFGKRRTFDFKDWEGAYEYNKKYGSGEDIVETFYNSLQTESMKIAEAEMFGDNTNFNKLLSAVESNITDPKGRKKFIENKRFYNDLYSEVFGRNSSTSTAARFFREQRNISSLVNLGLVTTIALPTDISNGITAIASENGGNFFQATGKYLNAIIVNLDKKQRIKTLEAMDFTLQGALSNVAARLGDDNNYQAGIAHNLNQRFYKINLLNWTTNLTRSAAARVFMLDIGDIVSRASSLDKVVDLEALRKFNNVGFTNTNFLDLKKSLTRLEGFNNLDVITMESLRDAGASADTMKKYSALSRNRSRSSTIEAGPLERVQMRFGSDPNSLGGAALQSFTQYKSFALADFRAKEKAIFRADKVDSESLLQSGSRTIPFISKMFILAGFAGYISTTAKSLAKGEEPPNPLDPAVIKRALMLGGALGMYGDVLLQEYDKNYISLQSTLLGPLGDQANDLATLVGNMSAGNIGKSGRDVFRVLENLKPNLPIFSTALDYMILRDFKEFVAPGSARRKERRFREQSGLVNDRREYLFPAAEPTETAF